VVEDCEERDPPPGPFASAPVDGATCLYHFENVPQLYCGGTCSWAGPNDCDQADADVFCQLRTGNPSSTALSFNVVLALDLPGFPCTYLGDVLGPLPGRGITFEVQYQDTSILANHGYGDVIEGSTLVCS
jgi:hypothetical protein